VHRSFAQIAVVESGLCRDEGRIGVRPEDLRAWAITLEPDDEIALEASTNSDAIATMLRPLVRRVVVSNPRKTRAIAEANVKTDKVDARIRAQLLAADFLPETWVADERTRTLRRLVMRRTHLVKQRTRLKNQVHGILSRNLVPTCPHADLFSAVGRRCLTAQDLPHDEWRSVDALVRQLDFHGAELANVERDIAIEAIDDPIVARLMTVPGIDVTVAIAVVAAVGDFSRFDDPNLWVPETRSGCSVDVPRVGVGACARGVRARRSWRVGDVLAGGSGCLVVLVDEPATAGVSSDRSARPMLDDIAIVGCVLSEAAVGSVFVVVLDVVAE
jgi:hypothetical protein